MSKLTGDRIRYYRRRSGIEVPDLARKMNYNSDHFSRIEKGHKGSKKVSVPDGFGPPLKRALLELLEERKQLIEKAEDLNE